MTLDQGQKLSRLRLDSRDKFNNTVVSVSSGALALTVSFRDRVQSSDACLNVLLKVSWSLFALCVVFGTIHALHGAYIAEKAIRQLQTSDDAVKVDAIPFFVWSFRLVLVSFCAAVFLITLFGILAT